MSIEENKALVRRWYDLWIDREWESLYDLHAGDFVDHSSQSGQRTGLDGILQSLDGLARAFPDCRIELTHVVAENDLVVNHAVMAGTHKNSFAGIPASGKSVSVTATNVWRIVDGKIAELWHVEDIAGLMQQLGSMPNAATTQPSQADIRRTSQRSESGTYAAT